MNSLFQKIKSIRIRKNKFFYYTSNFLRLYVGRSNRERELTKKLNTISKFDQDYILKRVNYYNKIQQPKVLTDAKSLAEFVYTGKLKTYFFDTIRYTRYFKRSYRFKYLFGDITEIPSEPSVVKSRPIGNYNENSVLLNLNKIRHFKFIHDRYEFAQKKDQLVWRGYINKGLKNRIAFVEKFIDHPMCNIGQVKGNHIHTHWFKNKLTIDEQLQYKFILSLEGNDVATNLKWIMSSNSVAVMPKPKYETWFMEGTLIPDFHYIQVKSDYSDLEEKLNYYILNTDKAIAIINNANNFVVQFQYKEQEDLISLMVLKKYFQKTNY